VASARSALLESVMMSSLAVMRHGPFAAFTPEHARIDRGAESCNSFAYRSKNDL
jgi:hypothetical protein